MATIHPVTPLRDLFFRRIIEASRDLLNTPGLELTYKGRGALLRACLEIAVRGKREILVPAYHCPSGIIPALQAGLTPVFYRIRRDLKIDYQDLLKKAGPDTAAVLVIHFFGFGADLAPLAQLRASGIPLIEDWSHSFIQGEPPRLAGSGSNYRIYSFWKLVPSGIGGGLIRPHLPNHETPPISPAPRWRQIVDFERLLEESLDHSDYRSARAAFSAIERTRLALKRSRPVAAEPGPSCRGEDHYPYDPRLAMSRMPAWTKKIIESSDLGQIAHKRRDNFRLYGGPLANCSPLTILYPELPAEVCPWVFPVLIEDRSRFDRRWRDSGVALHTFGNHLHSALFETADAPTISDANFLADRVLCLSIHQYMTGNEIESAARIIHSGLSNVRLPTTEDRTKC